MGVRLHAGDDFEVHYAVATDPRAAWLCGKGSGGSIQREDLDWPCCQECRAAVANDSTPKDGAR